MLLIHGLILTFQIAVMILIQFYLYWQDMIITILYSDKNNAKSNIF